MKGKPILLYREPDIGPSLAGDHGSELSSSCTVSVGLHLLYLLYCCLLLKDCFISVVIVVSQDIVY